MYKQSKLKSISIILTLIITLGILVVLPSSSVHAATITVCSDGSCDYMTIQAAITAASENDVITIANGTYHETLDIDKPLSLIGESQNGVIIDPQSIGGYGIYAVSDNLLFQNFTLQNAQTFGLKIYDSNHVEVNNVKVQVSGNTNIDFNGVVDGIITDVTSINSLNGNGISITDSNDIVINNTTTSGNSFTGGFSAGVGIFASGEYATAGCNNINFSENNFGEDTPIYTERSDPSYLITNLDPGNYDFALKTLLSPEAFYYENFSDAKTASVNFANLYFGGILDNFAIWSVSEATYYVDPDFKINTAIQLSEDSGKIKLLEGTFLENVALNKPVIIIGSGSGNDPDLDSIVTSPLTFDSKVGVFQVSASGLSESNPILLQDLRVEPRGQAGISIGRFTESTGQTVRYLTLDNIQVNGSNVNPSTEQERGLYVDLTSTVESLNVIDSSFDNLTYGWYFQKAVSAETSTVSNVFVSNTTFNHNNHKGIYVEKLTDATFDGITVSQNGFSADGMPTYFVPWMSGVDINLKAGNYENIVFTNSTISNNGLGGAKEGVGLAIKARDDGSTYATYPATLSNVEVTQSTITGNERGIRIGEPGKDNTGPSHVSIQYNNIYDNVQTYTGTDGSAYGDLINQSLSAINGQFNWWGSPDDPAGKIVGDVIYCPWLDDELQNGESYYPADNRVNNIDTGEIFCSIQDAIDDVDTIDGNTIEVSAGNYYEDITIDKSLTILGPNAAIDPNQGTRVSEAIIYPTTHDPDPYSPTSEPIIYIEVDDVAVKGLTIDGDNPLLEDGFDAIEGIASYEGVSQIIIENNIIQNFTYAGMDFYNSVDTSATTDNYIQNNMLQNIGDTTYNWGIGILLYNNFYADVTGNVFNDVRVGIQTGNYSRVNPGTTGNISNNSINAWRLGIFHNLWYSNASTISVDNNTINAVEYPGYAGKWYGMLVSSFGGDVNTLIEDNLINIPDSISLEYSAGYVLWNDTTTALLKVNGGEVDGGDYGIFANNYDGYNSNGGSQIVQLENVTISNTKKSAVYVKDNEANTNDAIVTLNVLAGNQLVNNPVDFLIEGQDAFMTLDPAMYADNPYLWNIDGAIIQAAIDEAAPGDTIVVLPGTYQEQLIINKDINLIGEDSPIILVPDTVAGYHVPGSSKLHEPVVFAFGGTADSSNQITGSEDINVLLSGFVIDGNDRVPEQRSHGVLFYNADGQIQGNTIQNMHIDGKETFGISVHGDSETTVQDNNVSGYSRGGIAVNGDLGELPDPFVTIENNIVVGPGRDEAVTWAPNGIQIGWGATGTVQGNDVSENGWPGEEWSGTGILIAGSENVQVMDNHVHHNETGIALIGDAWYGTDLIANNTTIFGNSVEENTYGISVQDKSENTVIKSNKISNSVYDGIDIADFYGFPPVGTVISFNQIVGNNTSMDETSGGLWIAESVSIVQAENNWWGCNEGPGQIGCDSIIGEADADPWLVLSVDANPNDVEPGFTSIIEGNLKFNSDDFDTSSGGFLPDDMRMDFTAPDGGIVDPETALTENASATTIYTAPTLHGDYHVCAEVDNAVVCPLITVIEPDAIDDLYETRENEALVIDAPGVMSNDTGITMINKSISLVTPTQNGMVTLKSDGSFTYTPDPGFIGTDTFVYELITYPGETKNEWTDQATVTITVLPGIPGTGGGMIYLPIIVR